MTGKTTTYIKPTPWPDGEPLKHQLGRQNLQQLQQRNLQLPSMPLHTRLHNLRRNPPGNQVHPKIKDRSDAPEPTNIPPPVGTRKPPDTYGALSGVGAPRTTARFPISTHPTVPTEPHV
ncbi:hypothetical protein BDD12DRAFT_866725, partial [Trichophaea hybrida]